MLIGLHGKKQAGKDTVYARAAHLMDGVLPVDRVSFADLLYRSAAASLGVSVPDLGRWKTDPRVKVYVGDEHGAFVTHQQTIREYLQRYGTEAHREVFGTDFWVNAVDLSNHDGRIVMVTDVRFENEAQAVRRAGGYVFRVLGPDVGDEDDHASERPLAPWFLDGNIVNRTRDDAFVSLDVQVESVIRDVLP